MIESAKFVKSLKSNIYNNSIVKSLNENELNSVNNYFEVIYDDIPIHPFVDLDGELQYHSMYEFEEIDRNIKNVLSTIPNVSCISSSKYNCMKVMKVKNENITSYVNKLSYRITWYDEVCSNVYECKKYIENTKYPFLQNLLQKFIDFSYTKTNNGLNLDLAVYRSGKMRCVNAYKEYYDKERINKLFKGNIQQTIISANYNDMELLTKVNQNEEIKNEVLEVKTEPVELKNIVVETKPKKVSKKMKKLQDDIEKEQKKMDYVKNDEKFKTNILKKIIDDYLLNDYLSLIDILKLDYTEWIKMTIAYKKCGGDYNKYKLWNMKSPHYDEIGLSKLWNTYTEHNIEVGYGTIKYYANLHNPKKYENMKKIIKLTFECASSTTEKDIADLYISLNRDNLYAYGDIFYLFTNGKWVQSTSQDIDLLRFNVNKILRDYLINLTNAVCTYLTTIDEDDPTYEVCKKYSNQLLQTTTIVNKTQWINNIVREVRCNLKNEQIFNKDIFDKQHHIFAFNNTLFDLNTNEQLEFNKEYYITLSSGKDYIEPTDTEMKTIHDIFVSILPDEEVRKCYLSILRNGLSGNRVEKIIIANGSGRNGKGLINEMMEYLLGEDYFYKVPVDLLTKDINMMGVNPQLANMKNKRFVLASEPAEGRSLKINTCKEITGCGTLNARGLYQTKSLITLLLTLVIEANSKPLLEGTMDDAVIERMIDILFPNSFTTDEDKIDNIKYFRANKLFKTYAFKNTHYSAFFKYILENAPKDLYEPDVVRQRSKEYVMDNDDLYMWMDDNYTFTNDNDDIIKVKDIFKEYKNSSYYTNLTKKAKRKENYKHFNDKLKYHILLKKMYRDDRKRIKTILYECSRLHGIKFKYNCELSDIDSDIE
jgi:phage/plasmid-associated DNA primase